MEKYKNEKGFANSDLYDQAMISRQLYSKIVSELYYHPDKNTVILIGPRLTREKMDKPLASAGYSLSNCIISDLIIMFCIEKEIYNINDVNALLFRIDQKVLLKNPPKERRRPIKNNLDELHGPD